ncbi:actin-related protein 8 [Impatiens glandulifera]|uniref:actin-related protein 8 n=1 Tax=Impatiens glandulifera TaxID=253017 RepID=UPI001FB07468|nr:actin-related protein 8 [Impatiens glandulifera]
MASLLRKVWISVSNRSGSSLSSTSLTSYRRLHLTSVAADSAIGAFDRIPLDILMQILIILCPKDVARLAVVCKAFRTIVADNSLWIYFLQKQQEPWDSILFGETHLRLGYPIQSYPDEMTQFSFMQIFSQREQCPGAVIIDGGSGYCKFGWSKYQRPSGQTATFLEFGNIESPMYSRLRHFFATIYNRMQVKTSNQPLVLSIPICHYDDTEAAKAARKQLKETIHSSLFDMNVPAVCAINQATLALYAARKTSGIVVNIGFQQTSVVPILHGKVMRKVGVEVVGMGALKLTGFLRELMQRANMNFESLYTVRTLKENLCYVALDYEAELSKDTRATFEVAGEGQFTLSRERFEVGEILFRPRKAGVLAMGLHQAVALCMDHCHSAELIVDESWFKTIVLSGGSACLPGLAERLEKELHDLLPPSVSTGVKVIPPSFGVDSAWFGAKLVSNLSTFPSRWCVTKKQFRRRSNRLMW